MGNGAGDKKAKMGIYLPWVFIVIITAIPFLFISNFFSPLQRIKQQLLVVLWVIDKWVIEIINIYKLANNKQNNEFTKM